MRSVWNVTNKSLDFRQNMKIMISILLLVVSACGSDSSAAPKRNNVIHIDSVILRHDLVSVEDQRAIQHRAINRVELEYGVKVVVDRESVVDGFAPKISLDHYGLTLGYYTQVAFSNKFCVRGKNRLCFISASPVFDKTGVDYGGGIASGIGAIHGKGATAWYASRSYNLIGQSRVISSENTGVHEFSHLGGAEHQDFTGCIVGSTGCTAEGREYPNIMHSAAGKYGEKWLPVGWIAHKQVNDTLKRAKVRVAKKRRSAFRPIIEPLFH